MYLAILTLRIVLFLSLFHIGLLFKFPYNLHIRRWERTFLSVYFFFCRMDVHGCIVAWLPGCIKYNESENHEKSNKTDGW